MGCASSRQRHQKSRKKLWRSLSMEPAQSPPRMSCCADQPISLKPSTTLGSLILASTTDPSTKKKGFSIGVVEAKAWSTMMEEKIPKNRKTPSSTPPGEPEAVIDVWELMSDLEKISPLRPPRHGRSFSFEIASEEEEMKGGGKGEMGVVSSSMREEEGEKRVVVYMTSLRGVRRTYEECGEVRVIMKGMGVKIEERDVSMDAGFREELRGLLGGGAVKLPMVFVGGRELGGAAEVRRLHEDGRLGEELSGCCTAADGGVCCRCGDVRFVPCDTCWGSCKIYCGWGEDDDDDGGDEDDEEDEEEGECGFRRCPDCNENGVRRCPVCF